MNISVSAAGWVGGLQAAAQGAATDRELPWISVVLLGLAVAAFLVTQVVFLYHERRWFVIRRVPCGIGYELKRVAERERRSLDQQAVTLIEEALQVREDARYGRVGAHGARGGELRPAV